MKHFRKHGPWKRAALIGALFLVALAAPLAAQQQFDGWCAPVKMEILQEFTLERVGFEATLRVTNNQGEDPITDFFAELIFEDPELSEDGQTNDASAFFFVRAPELEQVNAVDGGGTIGPGRTAVVRWFIIPKPNAGGETPRGKPFRIGARLGGKLGGVEIPSEQMFVRPETITVRPEAQLEITYFLPRDVQANNPFTAQVESPVPFTLGVLVTNSGFGIARNVVVKSEQPRIVENVQGLLLVAQLLGARVMDSPLDRASLTVGLGDLQPGETRKGAWDMITTLSGEFIDFRATYTHASELGGEETSLIRSLNSHFFIAEVMNDQPGRDDVLDFLAVTDRNPELIPDALYESEGNILPVNHHDIVEVVSPLGADGTFRIRLDSRFEGWGFLRLHDPAEGMLDITRVTRSDGKVLHARNAWTNLRYEPGTNRKLTYLNILDLVDAGTIYEFVIELAPPDLGTEPPVTEIRFSGEVSEVGDRIYVTRQTQVFFIADHGSPVTTEYSLNGGPFLPALPFTLSQPGEYLVRYFSEDVAGNVEEERTATLVLPGDEAAGVSITAVRDSLLHAGDTFSVRPGQADLLVSVEPGPVSVSAEVSVFEGVVSFPTIARTPPSPTPFDTAVLTVGGDHVDFYRYRVNGGDWSTERPVDDAIELSGLSGAVTVAVAGRSRFGEFSPDAEALEVSWTVDSTAPPFVVSGVPASPARRSSAVLNLAGEGISLYRWTIDNGFFRAEAPLSEPMELTALPTGERVVSIIGYQVGEWQATESAAKISWTIDPAYGSDFSTLPMVYSHSLEDIGGSEFPVLWDGRDAQGKLLPAGLYTVRVIAFDTLGRSSVASQVVHIESLAADVALLAGPDRAAQRPHARGDWSVWQDRASGTWNIVAQRLGGGDSGLVAVTTGSGNNEHPSTDGRYVAWQNRSASGAWDIWVRDLETLEPAVRVTDFASSHDTRPAIDWPWVVYESRPVGHSHAPVQVRYRNLVTGDTGAVDPTSQDQRTPDLHTGRVVWHDLRNPGSGEIYFANLETGEKRRLTHSLEGQFLPKIFGHWVVWQDNRYAQLELFGYDFLRGREVRLTDSPANETHPAIHGDWVVFEEDSAGLAVSNLQLLHLDNLHTVPLTNTLSSKTHPAMAGGSVVWQETGASGTEIRTAALPALQALFANSNTIPVSPELAARYGDAFSLLADWRARIPHSDISAVTRYTALAPEPVAETAHWMGGAPAGENFALEPGGFLWIRFGGGGIADFGNRSSDLLALANGATAVGYTGFPPGYRAHALIDELGTENVRAVRVLDSKAGVWRALEVRDGEITGPDFPIPEVAVVFVEMENPVVDWRPHGGLE